MPAIHCPTCQKEYRWKPELAGRRVKCKCGTVIAVPAKEPSAEPDELYDLADSPDHSQEHSIGDLQGLMAPAAAVQETNQFRCPYCGQDLEAGATMCVFCGTNFEAKAAAKKRPASAMASAPPVSHKPVVVKADSMDRGAQIKLAVIAVILIAVVVGAVFGLKKFGGKSNAVDPNLKPADQAIVEKINDENGVEAREWLNKSTTHMLGTGWSTKQALFNVDHWYQLGAKKVYAFSAGISLTAVIELPDDAAKRKDIFSWATDWNRQLPPDLRLPATDSGQKYLEISAPR